METCIIYNLDGLVYIIPTTLMEKFEATPFDDREESFLEYILLDGMTVEGVTIDNSDFRSFLEDRY